MNDVNTTTTLSAEEKYFNDCIRRGDDFMKISILRRAKEWYTKAVEAFPENDVAKAKLADCQEKLTKESRSIVIIVSIIVLVAVVVALL